MNEGVALEEELTVKLPFRPFPKLSQAEESKFMFKFRLSFETKREDLLPLADFLQSTKRTFFFLPNLEERLEIVLLLL